MIWCPSKMKNKLYYIVLLWFLLRKDCILARRDSRATNALSSANTSAQGFGEKFINVTSTSLQIFRTKNQAIHGSKEKRIFEFVNDMCSLFLAADVINPLISPSMASMSLILRKPCKEKSFPLTKLEKILKSPYFYVNDKVAIFITGWMSDTEDDYVTDMADAFNCRGGYNFLVLDTAYFVKTLYSWSAYNTEEIGRQLALGLAKLVKQVPAKNIHLIGHSLGAHIAGYTGRYFKKYTSFKIARITGLDPAYPCFTGGQGLSGLQNSDATFVDVIHTNPDKLGIKDPVGDVDFYPEGYNPIKPGCIIIGCSHGRAFEYFTESVYPGNENNFLSVPCVSSYSLKNGLCRGTKYPMGFAVPPYLRGIYFLSVNSRKPYGKNSRYWNAVPKNCGKCKKLFKR